MRRSQRDRSASGPVKTRKTDGCGPVNVTLAHSWSDEQDPTGWHVSEKLDGVRAFWDGARFFSRQGNAFYPPDWFCADFPAHPLDGELFLGRGRFQECVSIVRTQKEAGHADWAKIQYVAFDAPAPHLVDRPFEERLAHLRTLAPMWRATDGDQAVPVTAAGEESGSKRYLRVLEHVRCAGRDDLHARLEAVERAGGEGLMLREPSSNVGYVHGRSRSLLKVKTFHDAEALVLGHEPGKGKHEGRLGALRVKAVDGSEFKVGTGFTDAQRGKPPKRGALITYRYQELTKAGIPRFPSFLRERTDISPADAGF